MSCRPMLKACICVACFIIASNTIAQRNMEKLGRGLIAVKSSDKSVFLSWRLLVDDGQDISFDLFRTTNKQTTVKLNKKPITGATNFIDSSADLTQNNQWQVRVSGTWHSDERSSTYNLPANAPVQQYLSVPLNIPASDTIDGKSYTYSANDASVADVDGDGEYEIILKWDPSNSRNPPQTGLTGNQIIDAYKMDGTQLWRINLGINIRSGAAYTQFMVYDFDGDGLAEMICKTADGTIDGLGNVLGDKNKDWRNKDKASPLYGKIVEGPEYITVFNGLTGQALATEPYVPDRYPLDGWGGIGGNGGNDNTGGRPDRFTACVAYLDGKLPSAVFVRGWYGRSALAAWDWRNGNLTQRWLFDSKDASNPYSGMGNHNLSVADVDNDGKDEICIGAMTVDDDGKGLYTTGLRHGDAIHLSDLDPSRPGLEVFGIHESEGKTLALNTPGVAMFDARTGEIIFSLYPGVDVGRGVAADIDPTHPGFENWGGPGGLRDVHGKTISEKKPSSENFVIWWDGDLTRELLDKNRIDKWDWKNEQTINLLTAGGCTSNNGTKSTPALSADLFGDWREEVIWRTTDNKELRIYTTTIPTSFRIPCLMHDPQYRLSIAWQNSSYNQPPHTGYYLGDGMKKPPTPNITTAKHVPKKQLIFSSDFEKVDTALWKVEMEAKPNSSVSFQHKKLLLNTAGGVTVWLNKLLSGNIEIEYTRKIMVNGEVNDRLSDCNQFWMATDPSKHNLFTRHGKFSEYDDLSMYYVGMGGNTNSTTRFRKYDNSNRKLLLEYKDPSHLLQPNKEYHIRTVVKDGRTSYWVDGVCYFDFYDPTPLQQGYFGFRSTWSRQEIWDLKIYQLD